MKRGSVTWQLTLAEVGRLGRSPYPWAAVFATLALLTGLTWDQAPNLAAAAVNAEAATFVVAATVMLLANPATLRDQRPGVPEMLAALPSPAEVRTRALLVASAVLGGGLAVLLIGAHLLIRLGQGPAVGRVDGVEVLAGVAAAALLSVAGVALGRWVPSPVAAPVALFLLGTVMLFGAAVVAPWHLPVAVPYEFQAFGRPSLPRLAFLTALLVLVVALAMLRHGARLVRVGSLAVAAAWLVAAGLSVAHAAPPMWSRVEPGGERAGYEPDLHCTERAGVTYCHYPGFDDWVPLWERAAAPIAANLPPPERAGMPTVVQQHREWLARVVPGEVLVGTSWGRGEAELVSRTRLAGSIAAEVTGLAADAREFAGGVSWRTGCDGRGQARTVVALWLAGQAAPLAPATMDGPERETSPLSNVGYGDVELRYAEELLAREGTQQHYLGALARPARPADHPRRGAGDA